MDENEGEKNVICNAMRCNASEAAEKAVVKKKCSACNSTHTCVCVCVLTQNII